MRHRNSQLRRSLYAFTLIELLVVIAIVAVLASILLPMLHRSIESAHRAHCVSNLRQMGPAIQLYAADNHGELPLVVGPEDDAVNHWTHQIQPYFSGGGAGGTEEGVIDARTNQNFICPSDDVKRNTLERTACSYGMNRYVHVNGVVTNTQPKKLNAIENPSRLIIVGDVWLAYNTVVNATSLGSKGSFIDDYHGGEGSNFLFLDGHVEFMTAEVALEDELKRLLIP